MNEDRNDTVIVKFNPPVKVTNETGKSWMIQSDAVDTNLPKQHVMHLAVGLELEALSMPRWLAVDRGFITDDTDDTEWESVPASVHPGITRYDLLQAAALHAILSGGQGSYREAVYESAKIADLATRNDR